MIMVLCGECHRCVKHYKCPARKEGSYNLLLQPVSKYRVVRIALSIRRIYRDYMSGVVVCCLCTAST